MRFTLALLLAPLCFAQLPAPNSMGVSMGHLHLNTTDLEAARRFWVDFLGASTVKLGPLDVYKFPNGLVMVRKAAVSGGSEGSAIDHAGFKVNDLDAFRAKAKAMGYREVKFNKETRQAFILNPDSMKVELTEDKSMDRPIVNHHIHWFDTAVLDTQAWYARMFGAKPGKRLKFEAADLPGVNLTFSPSERPTAPTRGRALDHIGFEIKGLEGFVKRLEAKGVKFDVPYRKLPELGISIAFFTDPWGAYVELTEGLNRL
ncbi:MAG: hypothetical protein IANPNBLG_00299 [Bryobacteraceae bacterium]|nr:hypothetical protein [Bryobacteraceae bacterium]